MYVALRDRVQESACPAILRHHCSAVRHPREAFGNAPPAWVKGTALGCGAAGATAVKHYWRYLAEVVGPASDERGSRRDNAKVRPRELLASPGQHPRWQPQVVRRSVHDLVAPHLARGLQHTFTLRDDKSHLGHLKLRFLTRRPPRTDVVGGSMAPGSQNAFAMRHECVCCGPSALSQLGPSTPTLVYTCQLGRARLR